MIKIFFLLGGLAIKEDDSYIPNKYLSLKVYGSYYKIVQKRFHIINTNIINAKKKNKKDNKI